MDENTQYAANMDMSTATAPVTPSTVCGKTWSTSTPATHPDTTSSAWPPSSGDNSSQESPARSTSSTGTELEVLATQQDPGVAHQAGARVLTPPADLCNCVHQDGQEDESEANSVDLRIGADACSWRCGAKRPRAQTSGWQQQGTQYGEGASFPVAGDQPMQSGGLFGKSPPADLSSPRRKRECLAGTHYPRPDNFPMPSTGPVPHLHQCGDQEAQGRGVKCGCCDLPGGAFGGSAGSMDEPLTSLEEADTTENGVADGSEESTVETSARGHVGVCRAEVRRERCDQVLANAALLPDPNAREAEAFREVGITGKEEFGQLFRKLQKLKWRWGSSADKLSNDFWILKAGAKTKTARLGVDAFKTKAAAVQYVQDVLRPQDDVTLNSAGKQPEAKLQSPRKLADIQQFDENVESQADNHSFSQEEGEEGEGENPEAKQDPLLTPEGRALQTALEALLPSNAPDVLKQREREFRQVLEFITDRVKEPSGGSLYLCGCPGTGKTQTMAHVQKEIKRLAAKGKIQAPDFHAFTGTAFTDPNEMRNALWRAVAGSGEIPDNIDKALSTKLKLQKRRKVISPMIIVVLDEIDQLLSQNRQVLRKLFEWADDPKSRLVLVGIANSIEFDVGFSDLNKTPSKVLFKAYTPEDLANILTERVGATFQTPAIHLCSKKIAATHGDARRAISLCREAVVFARRELQDKLDSAVSEEERKLVGQRQEVGLVTIRHISFAIASGRASRYAQAIAALSVQAQIVLSVAAAAVAGGGHPDGAKSGKGARLTQGELHEKCMHVWGRLRTGGGLSQIEFSGTIDMLAAQGLLGLKGKQLAGGRARQLVLKIEFSDVEVALGDQPFFKTVTRS